MTDKYTDRYVEHVIHALENISNLLAISLTKFIDPEDDSLLRSLTGVTLNECIALTGRIRKHYQKENESGN